MKNSERWSRVSARLMPFLTALSIVALAACGGGGGQDPILGTGAGAVLAPTVTAVAPADNATGVPTSGTLITATFSEAMAPINGAASFVLTCASPCVSPAGTVSLDTTNRIATFAVTSTAGLMPFTAYTATITGAKSLATGLPLASAYVWRFTTGVSSADTTLPQVTLTTPATTSPGPTTGVPTNSAITAVFTEEMAPASISASSFTLTCAAPCVAPAGTVNYAVGARTAIFTPAAALAAGSTYTATITAAATDLAGNPLRGNQTPLSLPSSYVWTFTTMASAPAGNVTVTSTTPASAATNVLASAAVNATFAVPSGLRLDPLTVTPATFTLTGPDPAPAPIAAASVVLDAATGRIVTFTPAAYLTSGATYTATIKGGAAGVKDLAIPANAMSADYTWKFTVVTVPGVPVAPVTPPTTGVPPGSLITLGTASTFGVIGGTGGTTNTGTFTVINGNLGSIAASTAVTGFHDAGPGCIYTETALNVGTVNGLIYTAAPSPTAACPNEGTAATFAIASQARLDAQAAYNALAVMPAGVNPGANLSGLTLAPGVYTAPTGSFLIDGGNLTLDAQGDANAFWVFQMATGLTVGGAAPRSVILTGGAQAKNVYWQVGGAATVNAAGGGTMVGTIIAQAGATFSTSGNTSPVTLNGRVLSLVSAVTMNNTVINVPAP